MKKIGVTNLKSTHPNLGHTKRTWVSVFNKCVLKCLHENVPNNWVRISKRPLRNPKYLA